MNAKYHAHRSYTSYKEIHTFCTQNSIANVTRDKLSIERQEKSKFTSPVFGHVVVNLYPAFFLWRRQ